MKRRVYKQADMTATPSKYPNGVNGFKDKPCRWCKKDFKPIAPSHLFCSDFCKDRSYTNSYYMNSYGLTIAEVESLLESQKHLCAICHEEGFKMHEGVWTTLCIDHDHVTGKVRGALCNNCNRGLGLFKDDIKRLLSAVSYLEGATTISEESTLQAVGSGSARHSKE